MAEDDLKNKVTALILFALFTGLILTIAIDFGAEYGVSSETIGGGALDLGDYKSSIENVSDDASGFRTSFEDGSVDDIDDASGMFGTLKKFIRLITSPFTLIGQILYNIFGIPEWVTNVILGILGIGLILGIWRVLRAGS